MASDVERYCDCCGDPLRKPPLGIHWQGYTFCSFDCLDIFRKYKAP